MKVELGEFPKMLNDCLESLEQELIGMDDVFVIAEYGSMKAIKQQEIERYETLIYFLLHESYEMETDHLTDIITDALHGFPLSDEYVQDANKTKSEFEKTKL